MKKLFTLLAFSILVCNWSYAQQTPASQDIIPQRTEEYCEIRFFAKSLFSNKLHAHIDFGNGEEVLKDAEGKDAEFISFMAVLNYMNSQGWKLIDVHPRVYEGSSHTFYVMKRSLE